MAYDVTTAFGTNNLVNDNTTDNTAKLNAIFGGTSTPALTAPYTLYFPGGAGYKFASTPNTVPANVTLYGDGKEYTVLNGVRAAPSGGAVFVVSTANVTIRDLSITTPDTANACDQCIVIGGATGLFLERVKFSNGNSALIRVQSAAQLDAVQCEFTRCYQNFSASGISGQLQNSTITACWFHDNNGTLGTQHCIYLNGPPVANVSVTGCLFQNFGGEAVAFKGDPDSSPGSFALACSVTGCQFIPNQTNGFDCIGTQKVQGLSIVGNSMYCPHSQGGIVLYDTENFVVSANNFTSTNLAVPGRDAGTFLVLANDNTSGNGQGVISNNVVSCTTDGNGVGNMTPAQGIAIYNGHNLSIHGNVFTGYYLGVGIFNQGTLNQNVDIRVNKNAFLYPANWTHIPNGGQYFFGNPNTFYAVAIDGYASKIQVLDNYCQRLTYELFFTQFTYTGQADSVRFRSASWPGDNTNTFGFQGGAAPTNCSQLSAPSTPFSASNTAHAYTTPTT